MSEIASESIISITLKGEDIHFQYVCSGEYKINKLYDYWHVKQNTSITFWSREDKSSLAMLVDDIGFKMPMEVEEIGDDYNIIISYGRKIADIELNTTTKYGGVHYIATVTYAEDYEGSVIHVYIYDKMRILTTETPCYIMQGQEKVFYAENRNNVIVYNYD